MHSDISKKSQPLFKGLSFTSICTNYKVQRYLVNSLSLFYSVQNLGSHRNIQMKLYTKILQLELYSREINSIVLLHSQNKTRNAPASWSLKHCVKSSDKVGYIWIKLTFFHMHCMEHFLCPCDRQNNFLWRP